MRIDEPTLITVLGLASLTAAAMFLVLGQFARHIPGVRYWAYACLAGGLASLLDGPRLIADWQLASLFFNIPFCLGQALILAGTMQFCARPHAARVLWSLALCAAVLTVGLTYVVPDSAWRIGALSLFQATVNLWTAVILWRYPDPAARPAFRFASWIAGVQAAAALAQGILVAAGSSGGISYASPEVPMANIVSWSGAMLNVLIGNWLLFLLIMLRLVADQRLAAERDALTGLMNRRGLRLHLDSILRRSGGGHGKLGMLILDVDHFKAINDNHGHEAGDRVLVLMGQVLLGMGAPNATPCRWGGEEFCIVVEAPSRAALLALAEQVRARFERESAALDGLASGITVSIGIAVAPLDARFDVSRLVSAADAQLYRAKFDGRNRVAMADDGARPIPCEAAAI